MRTFHDIKLADLTEEEVALAPQNFRELVRVLCVADAIAICEAVGGNEFYVPSRDKVDTVTVHLQKLRSAISPESYAKLRAEFGETRLCFPTLLKLRTHRRNEEIRALYDTERNGTVAIQKIIETYGLSRAHTFRILSGAGVCSSPKSEAAQPKGRGRAIPKVVRGKNIASHNANHAEKAINR